MDELEDVKEVSKTIKGNTACATAVVNGRAVHFRVKRQKHNGKRMRLEVVGADEVVIGNTCE